MAYLEHHGIEDVIQDALLSVLTVLPTAPLTHISVLLHAAALHRGEDATRSSHIQPPWGARMASSRLGNFEPSRWSWGVGGGTGCTGVSGGADRTRWLAAPAGRWSSALAPFADNERGAARAAAHPVDSP